MTKAERSATLADDVANGIWLLMAIMFVASSLLIRRLPRGRIVQLALVWAAIFLAVFAAVQYYEG